MDNAARLRSLIDSVTGCGDGGCLLKKPDGQHTNAGCRCIVARDTITTAQQINLHRVAGVAKSVPALLDEVEQLREKVSKLRSACDDGTGYCRLCRMPIARHHSKCELMGEP